MTPTYMREYERQAVKKREASSGGYERDNFYALPFSPIAVA